MRTGQRDKERIGHTVTPLPAPHTHTLTPLMPKPETVPSAPTWILSLPFHSDALALFLSGTVRVGPACSGVREREE